MSRENDPPLEHLLRLERLFKAASWRRTSDQIWASPNLFELFGLDPRDLGEDGRDSFRRHLLPMIHPDDVQPLIRFVADLEDTDAESNVEFRAVIDDVERTYRARASNADGVRTGFVHDITDQRAVEFEKRRAESMFETLADELPSGIYMGTVHGEAKYANPAFRKMLGVDSLDEIDWNRVIHPDDVGTLSDIFQQFVELGSIEPYRFRVVVDDEPRTLETRQSFVPGTGKEVFLGSVVDQTDYVRRERQLVESERQLEWSQRISNTATWHIILDPIEIHWSNALYRMLDRDPNTFEVTNTSFFEHVAEGSREETTRIVESAEETGESWDYEVQLVSANGRKFWARSIGEAVLDDRGEITGLRGVVQDTSEVRALQDQVRRAEKFQALGELAGGIAHDFNNMLAAILGNAELLAGELTGESLADSREIINTARRCGDLTNQLLAFSSRRPLQSREVDIAQSIETVLGLVRHAHDKPIQISANLPDNPPLVSGEASLIENALLNVSINASQAMQAGGKLTIDVEHTFLRSEDWGDEFDIEEGPAVAIRITDTGVGIRPENIERVLDPFFSTRRDSGGTGLGLATTFGMVRNHGGAMKIESEFGKGTSVTLILPSSTEDVLVESDEYRAESLGLTGLSALVVDDELAVRRVVSRHLTSLGASTDSAGGHREAVDLINGRDAAGDAYDIGIFDLSMPDGRGTETAAAFREVWPFSAVLIISGFDVHTALDRDRERHQVLQKPFTREGLARAVHAAFDRTPEP